jgi:hypothetical protein
MPIQSNVVKNAQTVEYGKFVELVNDSRFPAISVTRVQYQDTSNAFPNNQGLPPLTSVDVYPKFAVLTYLANASDIAVSLSAGDINVNLSDVENLITRNNTLIDAVSSLLGSQLGTKGFNFYQPSNGNVTGTFTAIQVVSACKFSAFTASNSTTTNLTNYELPQSFTFTGPITNFTLQYGAIIAYKG